MPPKGASRLSAAITLHTHLSISPMFTRLFTHSFTSLHSPIFKAFTISFLIFI